MASDVRRRSHARTHPALRLRLPLCEAAKGARNQAIEHLSEALYLLAGLRNHDDQPTVRLNLGPIGVTGDDAQRCHSIDLPAKLAEGLADAIDSMTAYAMQDIPVDRDSLARKGAELAAWMEGQTGEAIATGSGRRPPSPRTTPTRGTPSTTPSSNWTCGTSPSRSSTTPTSTTSP
ncbi:hypothetical protein KJK32_47130 (plasmid) [Streptomyces sp. JCM17656]|nr:hypothetical protein KJK32_47130 [Streptomyces sp. JCM17656]